MGQLGGGREGWVGALRTMFLPRLQIVKSVISSKGCKTVLAANHKYVMNKLYRVSFSAMHFNVYQEKLNINSQTMK